MSDEQTKRKVGRPAKTGTRAERQAQRRFFSIQKSDSLLLIFDIAKAAYKRRHGVDPKSDVEVFRDALIHYL
jgi:hypothetical protein